MGTSFSTVAQVERVVQPAPADEVDRWHIRQDGCTGDIIFVVYDTVKTALAAVAKLHGQQLTGGEPKGKGKRAKKGEGESKGDPVVLWARQVSGDGAHLKKWRLIVRNLPFDVRPMHTSLSLLIAWCN